MSTNNHTPGLSNLDTLLGEVEESNGNVRAKIDRSRVKKAATKPPVVSSGQRFDRRRNRYKAAMYRACSPADLKEILERAVADAKNGDKEARKLVCEHLLGKPEAAGSSKPAATRIDSLQMAVFGADNMPLVPGR